MLESWLQQACCLQTQTQAHFKLLLFEQQLVAVQVYGSNDMFAVVQDILHRVSTPSQITGSRPRYSLVWKLVFMPRVAEQQCCIAKALWGPPTAVGSAARVESIKRSMLRKRKDSSA